MRRLPAVRPEPGTTIGPGRAVRPVARAVLVIVAAALATAVAGGAAGCGGTTGPPGRAVVIDVIDGDTVEVRVAGRSETVRLLGIDTPETVAPGQPVDCYGPEASARTKELLPPGTAVDVRRDVEARDRFGRLLAYVTRVDDGLLVNRSLVADGYARVLSIEPNTALRRELADAQAEARRAGRGLWNACSGA
ncbi:MAG: thermonuclease family protein [Acidimicrobiales bacterium]|nr:thermonuclease family protein [Acidimicrobiales bacterium]